VLEYVEDTEDREVLVVTGGPGAGKSAFMAECVRVCREPHPKALVVPHFIGAAPESASLPATLRSLCETLRREVGRCLRVARGSRAVVLWFRYLRISMVLKAARSALGGSRFSTIRR
jgi:hypothetical protein